MDNLTRTQHKTWAEIDISALQSNLRCIRAAIGEMRRIILVVKSDAYGHGAGTVASVAAAMGVQHFAVASVDEGAQLRRADLAGEILLLHPPLDFEVPAVIQWRLSPTVSDEATAQILSRHVQDATVPVHVEINTGLNRLGLDWPQAADVIARIAALPGLRIAGVFTHFRAAFSEGALSVRQQMERFDQVMADLAARGIEPGLRHAASSVAMAFYPDTYLDGVRPGMMVYGGMKPLEPAHATTNSLSALRPVMAVRTRIIHVKSVAAGEWIHYGETFQAQRPMRVAVLPIGYGMGYSRHLSNNGEVLIGGRRVPIIGVIGMDMTVVDVTSLPTAAVGDVATVLGRDGGDEITAVELAERIGTISYEITCRLGNALPRYVVGESVAEAAAPVGLVSTKHT